MKARTSNVAVNQENLSVHIGQGCREVSCRGRLTFTWVGARYNEDALALPCTCKKNRREHRAETIGEDRRVLGVSADLHSRDFDLLFAEQQLGPAAHALCCDFSR